MSGLDVIVVIVFPDFLIPIGVLFIHPCAVVIRFCRFAIDSEVFVKSKFPISLLNKSIFFSTDPADLCPILPTGTNFIAIDLISITSSF